MRFSPLETFRLLREKERGDDLEGATNILNEELKKVEFDHPTLGKGIINLLPGTLGRMVHFEGEPVGCFASYALTDTIIGGKESYFIDKRMQEFGDYAVMIMSNHMDEYFSRIRTALEASHVKYSYGHVTYEDFDMRGEITPNLFTKSLHYSHQSEHRILVSLPDSKPLFLNVGSIEDIAELIPVKLLLETEFKGTKYKQFNADRPR